MDEKSLANEKASNEKKLPMHLLWFRIDYGSRDDPFMYAYEPGPSQKKSSKTSERFKYVCMYKRWPFKFRCPLSMAFSRLKMHFTQHIRTKFSCNMRFVLSHSWQKGFQWSKYKKLISKTHKVFIKCSFQSALI